MLLIWGVSCVREFVGRGGFLSFGFRRYFNLLVGFFDFFCSLLLGRFLICEFYFVMF